MTAKARGTTGRRWYLYRLGFLCGVLLTFIAWSLILLGVIPPTPTDDIISAVVLVGICTPFVAFWDNPGETRTVKDRLVEFGFLWLLMSGLAQTLWELPWWLLDVTGAVHHIGPDDTWLWPWWAYGVADTRYLTSNPTIAGVELCAGFAGPFELYAFYLYKTGKRIAANWWAVLLGTGLAWGGAIFFYAEIHEGFVNIGDGAYGFWVKWFGLNIPWIISPVFFIPAAILDLRALYEDRGAQRARLAALPATMQPEPQDRYVA